MRVDIAVLATLSYIVGANPPQWSYWPLLNNPARFTGRLISPSPPRLLQKLPASPSIDLFHDTPARFPLLYGSVLHTVKDVSTDSDSVAAVLSFLSSTLHWNAGEPRVLSAKRMELQATADNGQSRMIVESEFLSYLSNSVRFHFKVNFGINYALKVMYDGEMQKCVVTIDRNMNFHLLQHTYTSTFREPEPFRIVSYNVWNMNPPMEVYGAERRWTQYTKRIDHLIQFIRAQDPGIIGFQEVRFDSTFGEAQVEHLAHRLPGYQYVYQAAMTYINRRDPLERIEEGPAIFSKYPIESTDYVLLSRDPNDPNDTHQRLCLRAVIDVPSWGLVDVYVTHLSLSERSREQTMKEIWHFMKQGRGETQFLLGDLNAEPQSRGIRFLQGFEELDGERTDLRDSFLDLHTEPVPRSTNPIDIETKFTFPADHPVKRIDYVLYRGKGTVKDCRVIGQAPTSDTLSNPASVGMTKSTSPVWASDHRGVAVELTL